VWRWRRWLTCSDIDVVTMSGDDIKYWTFKRCHFFAGVVYIRSVRCHYNSAVNVIVIRLSTVSQRTRRLRWRRSSSDIDVWPVTGNRSDTSSRTGSRWPADWGAGCHRRRVTVRRRRHRDAAVGQIIRPSRRRPPVRRIHRPQPAPICVRAVPKANHGINGRFLPLQR